MSSLPHVLVLYCDQMQHSRMGFVDGIAHTPALDALAAEGVHFTHAITEQGQCVPSRAVFHTGQSAHECGVMVNYGFRDHRGMLTKKHLTLPKVLRKAGYRTVYFGKGHLGSPIEELGYGEGRVHKKDDIDDERARSAGIAHVPRLLRRDYLCCDETVDWLKRYESDGRPLFFTYSTNLPHPPFFREPKYADRFPPGKLPLPRSYYEETFENKPPYQAEHARPENHGAGDETAMRELLVDYYSMIAMVDEQCGRVIAEFKRLGIWDDTLVLFTGDHGDLMGAHRTRLKGVLPYDEIYRVPCVFKLSRGMTSKRKVVDDLVSSQALPGTLLKLAGSDVPASFTGGHFADAFGRERHPEGERVFFEHYLAYWGLHPFYGVRTRDAKFIRYYGDDATEELYDLAADPDELHNVADDPSYRAKKKALAELADHWWRDTGGRDLAYYESDDFRNNRHNL